MQAVIMAGGKGTRLSSVLKDIPKPMVNFIDRPLLEYQIENLKENGITDITMVVGFLGHVIQEYFGDGGRYGVKISYYAEKKPLGTAGALYFLKDKLNEDFILLFGDLFININFKRFYQYHIEKKAGITLYAHPNSHPYDSDVLVVNDNNLVTGWIYKNTERPEPYRNLVNAGVYVVSPEVLEMIPKNEKFDLEKQLISGQISNGAVYAYTCTEYVKDIGTPERLKKVEDDYRNGICENRNLKYKQKCIFIDRDGTLNKYIGFLTKREQLELETGVEEAIRHINESEYLAVVISNQPVIARGECSYKELEAIHNKLYTLLGNAGAYLDGLYYCPHHPDSGFDGEIIELKFRCTCRKPNIGMLEKAANDYNIDLEQSWFIGDTTVDIQTGINARMKTALVMTGEKGKDGKYQVKADIVCNSLLQCVQQILKESRSEEGY